jgi:hypothetical protein
VGLLHLLHNILSTTGFLGWRWVFENFAEHE